MIAVEHETVILASPPRVWSALTRFDDYRRWHPFVRVSGRPELDAPVDYSFRMRGGDARFRTVDGRITAFEAQRSLAFRFGLDWLFAFEESYLLCPAPTGSRLVHGFRLIGPLGVLPLKNLRRILAKLLETTDRLLVRHLSTRPPPTSSKPRVRKGFRPHG